MFVKTVSLSFFDRAMLSFRRFVTWLCFPLTLVIVYTLLFVIMQYRRRNVKEVRQKFARLMNEHGAHPILLCQNHLTCFDSVLMCSFLLNPWKFLLHYHHLPWQVFERRFVAFFPLRLLFSLMKNITLERMGDRQELLRIEEKLKYLLKGGDLVLIFPEGTRSRSGRVNTKEFQYGIGKILRDLPDCQVLCIYLRGENQGSKSTTPPYGCFVDIEMEMFKPTTSLTGLRAARDLSGQVIEKLDSMEKAYFAARGAL